MVVSVLAIYSFELLYKNMTICCHICCNFSNFQNSLFLNCVIFFRYVCMLHHSNEWKAKCQVFYLMWATLMIENTLAHIGNSNWFSLWLARSKDWNKMTKRLFCERARSAAVAFWQNGTPHPAKNIVNWIGFLALLIDNFFVLRGHRPHRISDRKIPAKLDQIFVNRRAWSLKLAEKLPVASHINMLLPTIIIKKCVVILWKSLARNVPFVRRYLKS